MIKVLIADDQKTVREILTSHIEEESSFELVGCANNGKDAIDLIDMYRPDIVLMDIEMPIMDGITATKIISDQFINTNVLIISVHDEDSYLNAALQVGAKGYLKKNTPAKELINAIYSAYKGYFQLGPGLLEQYLHKTTKTQSNFQEIEQLKSAILQQSKLLENLSNGSSKYSRNGGNSESGRASRFSNENRYAVLEKQLYFLSNRLEKLEKKIISLQQFGIFITLLVLCSASIGFLLLLFIP